MDVSGLNANNYNPNVVQNAELKLLERSILTNGWIQPILASKDGTIIDGFHRWWLSNNSKAVIDKYHGKVPVAILDVPKREAMTISIRINRAKGTHVAIKMSKIVDELINNEKMDKQQIAESIGATLDEVELLSKKDVFKVKNIADHKYSRAWMPIVVKGKIAMPLNLKGNRIESV